MTYQNLESLLTNMAGIWVSQKTIYSLRNKIIRNEQLKTNVSVIKKQELYLTNSDHTNHKIQICENYPLINKKIFYNCHIHSMDTFKFKGIIRKQNGRVLEKYTFIFQNNYLKINTNKNDISYTEYIFFVSPKLRISIIIIQRSSNYLAIVFNSHIKVNRKS